MNYFSDRQTFFFEKEQKKTEKNKERKKGAAPRIFKFSVKMFLAGLSGIKKTSERKIYMT